MKRRFWLVVLLVFILAACAPAVPDPTATAILTETLLPTTTQQATYTATPLPTVSSTPDPYSSYTIEYLQSRAYGGGQVEFLEIIEQNIFFTRYLIRYPSDGLNIYGFANIPSDQGPHPVIIALHGILIPPSTTPSITPRIMRMRWQMQDISFYIQTCAATDHPMTARISSAWAWQPMY